MRIKIISIILVFAFSILIRFSTLNQMGRTWDEFTYVSWGYNLIDLVKKGDFLNKYWYANPGFPPVSRYGYGISSYFDVNHYDLKGNPVFNYNLTYSRTVSVVLTSITALFLLLIGWKYFSPFVGVSAGVIFSLLPLSVGYGQIATLESFILFFFTGTVFWFLNFLSDYSKKNILFTGIFLGLSLGVKYTNALLLPLLAIIFILWYLNNKNNKKLVLKYFINLIYVFLIGLVTFFIIWPMPWFHVQEVLNYNYYLRVVTNKYPSIEIFFGKLVHVPVVYFFVYFLITAPILTLASFFVGSKRISDLANKNNTPYKFINKKGSKWLLYTLIIWFCFPFVQSFYNLRVQGIRYIIEIYAPFSIICAIGLDYLFSKITKDNIKKVFLFSFFVAYLILVLIRISPYYLDYYNIVVGGTGGVNKNRLFEVGWWGQGIKEAGLYVEKNASKNQTVGLAVDPVESMPPSNKIIASKYSDKKSYDYVIVSDFFVLRLGFDDSKIKQYYKPVYQVKADGATMVTVYKKR